ncbi:HAD hydrolase family protein [Streptococcus saliviloxodontae]|uniref:HAD superfamily hydrolase (TIGR01484 family) n=1 Tax=Streptococcus saliviloxodontae TaxID=1349416 RepID=A0ABS2PMC7_9STRE|nr:HAD family hydrolase [Streptococcus saliviloxodontae]MBM7636509.1 HAD superfamily hydrolase (TIGR01484 family) [Streptococcus saliviloxodontae]
MKFVFDLDGTLCFDGMTIADTIKTPLLTAEDYGHQVIFASARSYRDCIGLLEGELATRLVIGLNGGLAYQNGQLILQHQLHRESYQMVLKVCHNYNLPYFLDDHFNYAISQAEKIPFISSVDPLGLGKQLPVNELGPAIKMVIYMGNHLEMLADLITELEQLDTLDLFYHEMEECLYLNPYGVSKGSTILDLVGENFVAFGNDKNDIPMFDKSLYGVQVGDYPYLKEHADDQVPADSQQVALKIQEVFQEFQGK